MATAVFEKRGAHSRRSRRLAVLTSVVFAAVLQRVTAPRSASLTNLRKMPLTVAGLGCVDVGVFTASTVAGWIVTGLTLILLEYMIADES